MHQPPTPHVKRAATLMSKVIQTLGNLGKKK